MGVLHEHWKEKGLEEAYQLYLVMQKPRKQAESNILNKLSISDLTRNPYQPRQNFSETKLEELANSIKKWYNPTNSS